jgi:hypothetical protein
MVHWLVIEYGKCAVLFTIDYWRWMATQRSGVVHCVRMMCRKFVIWHHFRRLTDNQVRTFGSREHERDSREGVGMLVDEDVDKPMPSIQETEDSSIYVNSLHYDEFRRRLVTHFNIKPSKYEVKWPQR